MSDSPGAREPKPEPEAKAKAFGACPRCGGPVLADRFQVCPTCLMSDEEPEVVIAQGTLELGKELGHGGMGTVFRARHLRLGREVAVKFLPAELADSAEFRTRF